MIVLAGNSGKHSPRRPMNPLLRNRTNIPKNLFCWGRPVTIHNVDGLFVEGFVCVLEFFVVQIKQLYTIVGIRASWITNLSLSQNV